MKWLKYFLILTVLTSSFISCRKGPEDPLLSLTTRKNRISKNWQAYSYKIDGAELIQGYQTQEYNITGCGKQIVKSSVKKDIMLSLSKNGDYSDSYLTITVDTSSIASADESCDVYNYINTDTDSKTHTGIWNFAGGTNNTSSREQLLIYQEETKEGVLWDIIRLASDELKLQRKYIIPGASSFTTEEIALKPAK
ncbi:MAG: hypothetical protein M9958_10395 [Chitinophagales bacterium]|nr:hypothetical protein [Chitinophagales bacterium]